MSPSPDLSHAQWVKSSYSTGNGGACVEWAPAQAPTGAVPVRDSKTPHAPALIFTPRAWSSFISATSTGEFSR